MIPKIIHYCWFGKKEKPASVKNMIATWRDKLPQYEIKEWNEDNFDVSMCRFVQEAYDSRKFAFVADYVRLYVLYNYGGIYFDTDVEVIKPFDEFEKFDLFMGLEMENQVGTSVIGAHPHQLLVKVFLDYYNKRSFVKENGSLDRIPNTVIISRILREQNYELKNQCSVIDNVAIYPMDYFSPINMHTSKLEQTERTHSIHHFTGSWQTPMERYKAKLKAFLKRMVKR